MSHGAKGAILVGNKLHEQPDLEWAAKQGRVVQVETVEPVDASDSGFVCFLDSAPQDRELDHEDGMVICLHCLLDAHPEAGAGLDVAKEHGRAVFAEGEWHPAEDDE